VGYLRGSPTARDGTQGRVEGCCKGAILPPILASPIRDSISAKRISLRFHLLSYYLEQIKPLLRLLQRHLREVDDESVRILSGISVDILAADEYEYAFLISRIIRNDRPHETQGRSLLTDIVESEAHPVDHRSSV